MYTSGVGWGDVRLQSNSLGTLQDEQSRNWRYETAVERRRLNAEHEIQELRYQLRDTNEYMNQYKDALEHKEVEKKESLKHIIGHYYKMR